MRMGTWIKPQTAGWHNPLGSNNERPLVCNKSHNVMCDRNVIDCHITKKTLPSCMPRAPPQFLQITQTHSFRGSIGLCWGVDEQVCGLADEPSLVTVVEATCAWGQPHLDVNITSTKRQSMEVTEVCPSWDNAWLHVMWTYGICKYFQQQCVELKPPISIKTSAPKACRPFMHHGC